VGLTPKLVNLELLKSSFIQLLMQVVELPPAAGDSAAGSSGLAPCYLASLHEPIPFFAASKTLVVPKEMPSCCGTVACWAATASRQTWHAQGMQGA